MRYTISLALATLTALPAMAEVPRVVADFAPVQGLVATVMGDLGQPDLLLDRGANAHSFQLRPSQAAGLADADLVIWVGPEMSPWLDRTLEGLGNVAQLRLLGIPGTHLQDFGATGAHDHAEDDHAEQDHEGHDHEGHDHEGHDHAAEAAGHDDHDHEAHDHDAHDHEAHGHDDHAGHAHTGTDPHAWLDPANGAIWLEAIAAELGKLDPENAAIYAANAAAGKTAIAALDASLATQLAPVQGKPFVVFHDAYGYFSAHYGLTVAGSVSLGDATAPGAAHLKELTEKAGAALCLFPEAGHDPKLVAQMAETAGVKLGAPLDPEGAAVEPGAGAYLATLQGLADTLTGCLAQ